MNQMAWTIPSEPGPLGHWAFGPRPRPLALGMAQDQSWWDLAQEARSLVCDQGLSSWTLVMGPRSRPGPWTRSLVMGPSLGTLVLELDQMTFDPGIAWHRPSLFVAWSTSSVSSVACTFLLLDDCSMHNYFEWKL